LHLAGAAPATARLFFFHGGFGGLGGRFFLGGVLSRGCLRGRRLKVQALLRRRARIGLRHAHLGGRVVLIVRLFLIALVAIPRAAVLIARTELRQHAVIVVRVLHVIFSENPVARSGRIPRQRF